MSAYTDYWLIEKSLVSIKNEGPRNKQEGLCHNLKHLLEVVGLEGWKALNTFALTKAGAFACWEDPCNSGERGFPIKVEGQIPCWSFFNLDKYEGEYGAARMRLLDHLINHYRLLKEKEIDKMVGRRVKVRKGIRVPLYMRELNGEKDLVIAKAEEAGGCLWVTVIRKDSPKTPKVMLLGVEFTYLNNRPVSFSFIRR